VEGWGVRREGGGGCWGGVRGGGYWGGRRFGGGGGVEGLGGGFSGEGGGHCGWGEGGLLHGVLWMVGGRWTGKGWGEGKT